MAIFLNSPVIIHSGTMIGSPIVLGERSNFFDTREGIITGTVYARTGNDTFLGGVRSETVFGQEGNDRLDGGLANDRLFGGLGNDRLAGGLGNDKLSGGAGKDVLTGGEGADSFVFDEAPSYLAVDVVRDFSSVDDVFQIKKSAFTGPAKGGKLSADAFHLGPKAADAQDRIIYDPTTGILSYDPDGTGSGVSVKIAVLSNKPTVAQSDFIVI